MPLSDGAALLGIGVLAALAFLPRKPAATSEEPAPDKGTTRDEYWTAAELEDTFGPLSDAKGLTWSAIVKKSDLPIPLDVARNLASVSRRVVAPVAREVGGVVVTSAFRKGDHLSHGHGTGLDVGLLSPPATGADAARRVRGILDRAGVRFDAAIGYPADDEPHVHLAEWHPHDAGRQRGAAFEAIRGPDGAFDYRSV